MGGLKTSFNNRRFLRNIITNSWKTSRRRNSKPSIVVDEVDQENQTLYETLQRLRVSYGWWQPIVIPLWYELKFRSFVGADHRASPGRKEEAGRCVPCTQVVRGYQVIACEDQFSRNFLSSCITKNNNE